MWQHLKLDRECLKPGIWGYVMYEMDRIEIIIGHKQVVHFPVALFFGKLFKNNLHYDRLVVNAVGIFIAEHLYHGNLADDMCIEFCQRLRRYP